MFRNMPSLVRITQEHCYQATRTQVVILYVLLATAAIDNNIVDSSRRDISLTIFPDLTLAFIARNKNDLHISWSHAILHVI